MSFWWVGTPTRGCQQSSSAERLLTRRPLTSADADQAVAEEEERELPVGGLLPSLVWSCAWRIRREA
jgi:hypothetical protein